MLFGSDPLKNYKYLLVPFFSLSSSSPWHQTKPTHHLSAISSTAISVPRQQWATQDAGKMKSQGSYAPPTYIPLGQSDSGSALVLGNEDPPKQKNSDDGPIQWSSGICACCDDTQSCCIGLFCPCYLFGKNAEFLGSGTLMGSCTTHFILWVLVNSVCCLLTDGVLLGIPGCFVACYACGYRRALRAKYNLQEAPCEDFITHFFCHLCAICQEYREIREKSAESGPGDQNVAIVTAPAVQTMEPAVDK